MSKPNPLYLTDKSANAIMVMLDTEIDATAEIFTSKHEPEDYVHLGRKLIAYGQYRRWYEQQDCSDLLEDDDE